MPELRVQDAHLTGLDGRPVFRGLDVAFEAGDAVRVCGGSGYCRGQFLRLAAALVAPEAGSLWIRDQRAWPGEGFSGLARKPRTGFQFVRGGLLANQSLRANLELPLLFGTSRSAADIGQATDALLEAFGLASDADLRPHALDSRARKLGQLLRIRLLDPDWVLLDDPFDGLSEADAHQVEAWIRGWSKDPARLLLVALPEEDERGAGLPFTRQGRLDGGRWIEEAP